jgi:hypothetical protein
VRLENTRSRCSFSAILRPFSKRMRVFEKAQCEKRDQEKAISLRIVVHNFTLPRDRKRERERERQRESVCVSDWVLFWCVLSGVRATLV